MLTDFIIISKKSEIPIYMQIYNTVKKSIESGKIKENEKLPSIRKLCTDLNVSKTTVENAYNRLADEGYIMNKPQRGYFAEKVLFIENKNENITEISEKDIPYIKFDFSGNGIDSACSNIKEWKKYVKDILNNECLLNTYSENQGEEVLRKALEKYSFSLRGVNTAYNNIIIGSGSQTLIYILCGLLGINKKVAIEKNSYPQAEQVFRDFNYNIFYTENDSKGISIESLNRIKPDILLINPNLSRGRETAIPITRKLEIIKWANKNNCIIIEDDYNGELRYKTHNTPCMQSYDNDIIYIGSFSKTLLPSVRISYMVLSDMLINKYQKVKNKYNQTSSKIEQLALAKYLEEGNLEKHLRKIRRYYKNKSDIMLDFAMKMFDNVNFYETSMFIEITTDVNNGVLLCENDGIKLMNTSSNNKLNLSFSHINTDQIESGLNAIVNAIRR